MARYRLIPLLISFSLLGFISPARSAIETGATPPAADETLIYVMRVSRFVGGGGSFWVAVNDQTVDRLSNGRYAVIRAKAGRITLNLANAGIVFASTTLDDRPGETVYLKYRLGDVNLTEVSEAEGRKFLQKAKRTKGIEAPLPNNEEIDVLSNPSRLGLDLTRPATQVSNPGPENGVITFFRRNDGAGVELGIWSEQDFVSTLKTKEGVRLRVPTGDHLFLAGSKGTSILKAEVQAGKEYFVWLDYGEGFGGVRLTPVSMEKREELKKWLKPISWIELDSDKITPRIRERRDIVTEFMHTEVKNVESRISKLNLLGQEHAFDEKMLEESEISSLIAKSYSQQIATTKQIRTLTASEINTAIIGNTFSGENKEGTRFFIYHDTNKVMKGIARVSGAGMFADSGSWHINEQNQYCRQWKKWRESKQNCFQMQHRGGDQYRLNGASGIVSFSIHKGKHEKF